MTKPEDTKDKRGRRKGEIRFGLEARELVMLRLGREPWDMLRAPHLERVGGPPAFQVEPTRWRRRLEDGHSWGPWEASYRPLDEVFQHIQLSANGTVIVDVAGDVLKGFQIDREWREDVNWEWNGTTPRVVLQGRGRERSPNPIVEGLAWQNGAFELWIQNIDLTCGLGGSTPIGNTSQAGALRLLECDLVPPVDEDQKKAYSGRGINWGARTMGGLLHFKDCDLTAPCREHVLYPQNCVGLVVENCELGQASRTNLQVGTRETYHHTGRFLGVLVEDSLLHNVDSGVGGGAALTVWGYPGPIVLRNIDIETHAEHPLNKNRAIAIWEAHNYPVVDPEGDDFGNDWLALHDIRITAPSLGHSAIEIESTRRCWLGNITGSAPKWFIDSPDQWRSGPDGKIKLIDANVPTIRGYDADLGRMEHWTPEQYAEAIYRGPRATGEEPA